MHELVLLNSETEKAIDLLLKPILKVNLWEKKFILNSNTNNFFKLIETFLLLSLMISFKNWICLCISY